MRSGARQVLERRLTMIMRGRVPCRVGVYGFAGVALLALLALPSWSRVQERNPETTKNETSTKADVLVTKPIDLDFVLDISDSDVISFDDETIAQPTGDRDHKLHAVEQKLQKLLDEVRSLRGEGDKSERKSGQTQTFTIRPKVQSGTVKVEPLRAQTFNVQPLQRPSIDLAPTVASTDAVWVMNQRAAGSTQADILHRTKYKLSHEKAEALAKFLRDQVKGQTVETKVEGDYLTVTASPEAQRTIGQIVSLIDQKHVTIKLSTTPVEVLTEVTTKKAESKTKPKKAETRERDEEEEPKP